MYLQCRYRPTAEEELTMAIMWYSLENFKRPVFYTDILCLCFLQAIAKVKNTCYWTLEAYNILCGGYL